MTVTLDTFICFGGFAMMIVVMIVRSLKSPAPPTSSGHPPRDRRARRRDGENEQDEDGEARYPDEDYFLFEHFRDKHSR